MGNGIKCVKCEEEIRFNKEGKLVCGCAITKEVKNET